MVQPNPAANRFTGLKVDIPAIDELKQRKQWVTWKYKPKVKGEGYTKPPVSAVTGRNASHSEPNDWADFDTAESFAVEKKLAGVGYVMTEDDDLTGIDLDHCLDDSGFRTTLADDIIELGESYCEVSPSGHGLRLLVRGKIDRSVKMEGVELYRDKRYLTITADHMAGTPDRINPAPKTMELLKQVIAEAKAKQKPSASVASENAFDRPRRTSNEEIHTLLSFIPATCGYDEWLQCLMAIHYMTDGEPEGLAIANEWSSRGGTQYRGFDEVQSKWDSFTGTGVRSGTLAYIAGRYGANISHISEAHAPRGQEAGDWPQPIPIASSLPPVEPLIPGMLPEPIRGYVYDVTKRQQSPVDFLAVAALCGIASIVGNRVRIAPKQKDDWTVVPNFWGAIIGRPSAMKSPAMKSALDPIYGIENELKKHWDAEVLAAEMDEVLSGLEDAEAKRRAKEAIKAGNRDKALKFLADLAGSKQAPPPRPRMVYTDATVEKLGELLSENPRGMLLVRDELAGLLARLERHEFQHERTFYLTAFNGDAVYTFDRIGRGTIPINPCTLSIIGGIQPSRIAPIVRGAMTGASDDGFVQRLQLAVWPEDGPWKYVDRRPNQEAREAYEKVFKDLHAMELGDTNCPKVMRFSAAAQDLFQQWMEVTQPEVRSGNLSPTLESHLLKMPKTVASLALLFELVDGGRTEVGETSLRLALRWEKYLRSHANRLYSAGEVAVENGAKLILERRDKLKDGFTARTVQRKGWAGLTDPDAVAAAIELLVETNHCREQKRTANQEGGRPTMDYVWNPNLPASGAK